MRRTAISKAKIIFGSIWIGLLCAALITWWYANVPLQEVPILLQQWLKDMGLLKVALIYVVFYTIRPLVLFPATLLTVASGLIFGPWLGTLFTVIGENLSANLSFFVARWLGRKSIESFSTAWVNHWDDKLQQNGLLAVMTMRLIMLPFDAVNFGCGLTSIRHRDYAIGTFLGILPSMVGFVLLGGAAASAVDNRLLVFGLSILFILLGFAIAHVLKRRCKVLPDGPI